MVAGGIGTGYRLAEGRILTAGHVVLLSFICIVFVVKELAGTVVGTVVGFGGAVPFSLFINLLEIFVALLQAYIFTLLTALFIGMSVHSH